MFISMNNKLQRALQELHRAETEDRPLTPKEEKICFGTKKRAAEVRRVERAVTRFIKSESAYEKRTRHLNVGSYGACAV